VTSAVAGLLVATMELVKPILDARFSLHPLMSHRLAE
jgi:hypothetical protein